MHDEKLLHDLYLDEPMLWGYFAEGAPVNLTENIKPVRKLVNGSPALLDSLVLSSESNATIGRRCMEFDGNTGAPLRWTRCTMADVYRTSGSFQLVELDDPPVAVNVRVGGKRSPPGQPPGSAPGSVLWHGVELDDLSELIKSVDASTDDQVIPLFLSRNVKEGVELRGAVAAQAGLPIKVKVREHQYCLAHALTDFKLQGRTLAKLILLLSNRLRAPWITLAAFYVFISRVRLALSLRLVFKDDEAIKKVGKLRHDEFLQVREKGHRLALHGRRPMRPGRRLKPHGRRLMRHGRCLTPHGRCLLHHGRRLTGVGEWIRRRRSMERRARQEGVDRQRRCSPSEASGQASGGQRARQEASCGAGAEEEGGGGAGKACQGWHGGATCATADRTAEAVAAGGGGHDAGRGSDVGDSDRAAAAGGRSGGRQAAGGRAPGDASDRASEASHSSGGGQAAGGLGCDGRWWWLRRRTAAAPLACTATFASGVATVGGGDAVYGHAAGTDLR